MFRDHSYCGRLFQSGFRPKEYKCWRVIQSISFYVISPFLLNGKQILASGIELLGAISFDSQSSGPRLLRNVVSLGLPDGSTRMHGNPARLPPSAATRTPQRAGRTCRVEASKVRKRVPSGQETKPSAAAFILHLLSHAAALSTPKWSTHSQLQRVLRSPQVGSTAIFVLGLK